MRNSPWITVMIEGKRSRTPFVKPIMRDTGIKSYKGLKRRIGNRKKLKSTSII